MIASVQATSASIIKNRGLAFQPIFPCSMLQDLSHELTFGEIYARILNNGERDARDDLAEFP
jgi:hypothetical protein